MFSYQKKKKGVFGVLFLILLLAFGLCTEEKGKIQHYIAIHHQQQPEGRVTEAESEAGGSGKSKPQAPESLDSGGRKDSELGPQWAVGGISGSQAPGGKIRSPGRGT